MSNRKNVANASATKKQLATASSKVEMVEYHKPEDTPRGKLLFAYTLALFTVLGGFTTGRAKMSRMRIRNFFASNAILSHHSRNGNLEIDKDTVRLTVKGWNYFSGRLAGRISGQDVEQKDVDAIAETIRTGKTEDCPIKGKWISFKVKA